MRKIHLLFLIAVLFSSCDSPSEGFYSQIVRTDSLLVIKTQEVTDSINTNSHYRFSHLNAVAERRSLRSGEELKAKMFFWNKASYDPAEMGKSITYRMYYKNAAIKDTTVPFAEIIPVQDTAYVRFKVEENLLNNDTISKWWSGKITITQNGGDSTFLLQDEYRVIN